MAIRIKDAKAAQRGPGALPVYIGHFWVRGGDFAQPLHLRPAPPQHHGSGQWIVLLGPNGVGKTTLLRIMGLGLGRRYWLGPRRAFTASELRLDTHEHVDLPAENADAFAYGSLRGTALGGPDRDVSLDETDAFETLFSANARLIHAETWLRREKLRATADGRFFNAVLDTIASLLPGRETVLLEGDQLLIIEPGGRRLPFAAMSDGYLTTLGWTIDLIARWAHRYRDTGKLDENFAKDMPCIVLVDELDLHLHPEWQLDIIPRLRAAFPKTTFVVTTHNPLTLQGTRPGEVFVLERDAEGTIGITQRDITPGLDANRILTDWFGLPTTLDNDTRDLMAEHLKLLWEKVPESHARRRALERTLRERLGRYADTSLERIAQSVIAEVLHKKSGGPLADITPADRSEIVTQVKARLDDLDAPPASSTAREPAPTWRRTPTTSKARKPTTKRKAATKRKGTTARKPTAKR